MILFFAKAIHQLECLELALVGRNMHIKLKYWHDMIQKQRQIYCLLEIDK